MSDDRDKLDQVCRAVLLYHRNGAWLKGDDDEWFELTGRVEATSRNLCDFVREVQDD